MFLSGLNAPEYRASQQYKQIGPSIILLLRWQQANMKSFGQLT